MKTDSHRQRSYTALEALKCKGCITSYEYVDDKPRVIWTATGFEEALTEVANNRRPFGLRKDCAAIVMEVLSQTDPERVTSLMLQNP